MPTSFEHMHHHNPLEIQMPCTKNLGRRNILEVLHKVQNKSCAFDDKVAINYVDHYIDIVQRTRQENINSNNFESASLQEFSHIFIL